MPTPLTIRSRQEALAATTDLQEALCGDAPDQEACERFLDRLSEANDNIRLRES